MKNRKKLLLAIVMVVVVGASLTSWAITRASTKTKPVNVKYLQAFFERYVNALNAKTPGETKSFYSADAVTVGAWGIELTNQQREDYLAACKEAFPDAQVEIKKVTIEPQSETSGFVTWEFGIKAGKQVAPFLGVMSKNGGFAASDGYDQEGVSIGEVTAVDDGSASEINALEDQIAALDKEIASLDSQAKSSRGQRNITERRSDLAGKRALLDQQLVDRVVSTIKFTRQTSFQNMDRFLKKLNGD